MLRAANQEITSDHGTVPIYTAADWEFFSSRANGNFGSPVKRMHINNQDPGGCIQIIHDIVHEVILAPGDTVYASIDSSSFTLHYTASMIWPNEVAGGRKMASRSELYPLSLGETRNVISSKEEWYEVTFLSPSGSSAYRLAVGDSRGLQYAEPPPGKQWRCIIGPGDYLALIGGGSVSVGVTITELPPVDRLVKKIMSKLRGL